MMLPKFTLKYKKGHLGGVVVFRAEDADQAKAMLEAELLANHGKLPDKPTRVIVVEDQQGRTTPRQDPGTQAGKVAPAHVMSEYNGDREHKI